MRLGDAPESSNFEKSVSKLIYGCIVILASKFVAFSQVLDMRGAN